MLDRDTWWRVARSVGSGRAGRAGAAVGALNLLTFTGWSAATHAAMALDRWLWPEVEGTELLPPVFVVGNARSGTTLFHRLLCADDERFFHLELWEILMPALSQRRAVRAIGALDARLLGGRLAAGVTALDRWMFGGLQKVHPSGLRQPEEDEFLFVPTFTTPTLYVLFPDPRALGHLTRFDQDDAHRRAEAMAFYRACLRRRAHESGQGRRMVSKNPSFVAKLRSLRAEFPDAKFVYLVRDPLETLPSLLSGLRKVWRDLKVSDELAREALTELAEGCVHQYFYAMEVLDGWPAEAWTAVRYPDLASAPGSTVRAVYRHFGWSPSAAFDARLEAADREAKGYRSSHAYDLAEFGLDAAEIVERLAPVYDRFSLPRPDLSH